MSSETQTGVWKTVSPILRQYIGPVRWVIALGVFAGIVAASAGFGVPFLTKFAFPIVFGEQPAPDWMVEMVTRYAGAEHLADTILWAAALTIPLMMVARGIGTYFNTYLLTLAGVDVLNRLRVDIFHRLQWVSFSYLDRQRRGDLMTAVIQYTQQVQGQMVTILNDLVIQPLTLLAATGYLVYVAATDSQSAILLGNLLITALSIPLVRYVGKRMVKQMRKLLVGMNIISTTIEETLSAQREVRAFNLEERQSNILRGNIRFYNQTMLKLGAWQQAVTPAIEIVSALALSYSLYRGCGDGLTLEQFTAIALAFYFCYDPLKKLGTVSNQCQVLVVSIRKLMDIYWAPDTTPEPESPVHFSAPVQGVVDFDHVTFAYNEEKTVLKDITVHVPAGQVVALVGPSGSGKTTFINLICRFYDVQQGSVSIDGVDVRRLTREERTQQIALVSQFSALFRDSIRENIRVGRPGASDAEVESAGEKACVAEITAEKPEGYDFILSEGGGGLSGGQRQRVSIARAFLKNAPILILDEATSALDMRSEATIQHALEKLAAGHTTFVIAHRFSTIRMAQRILVFEEGRIVADGPHHKLYESCVLYRHLYDEQVRQAEEEMSRDEKQVEKEVVA